MISAVDHINIVVTDLERSVRFYAALLGLREDRRAVLAGEWIDRIVGLPGVEAEVVFLAPPEGGPRLELLHYRRPAGTVEKEGSKANTVGLRHVAFRVSDIAAAAARLREAGVGVLSDPVAVPGGIVGNAPGEKKLCYFLDPDGVLLELAQYGPSAA